MTWLAGAWLLGFAAGRAEAQPAADGWITYPDATQAAPIVLHFRRALDVARMPSSLPVTVTADNRFILYVNGARVASGPSVGTPARWRYSTLDPLR